jgi:hypothetical protein
MNTARESRYQMGRDRIMAGQNHSAAKPQPKPRNTRNTRKRGPNLFRIPRIPRFLSFGKLLAGCDQTGLLQYRDPVFGVLPAIILSSHDSVRKARFSVPLICVHLWLQRIGAA